jgi:hypothetical protein
MISLLFLSFPAGFAVQKIERFVDYLEIPTIFVVGKQGEQPA